MNSVVLSLDFEQINTFWTSGFDSVSILFDSLSVGRRSPELNFSFRFRRTLIWPWVNQYMVYGFDSSSIGHFPAMVCSISAEGSLNLVAHWIYIFLLLPLSEPFLVYFVGIWWSFTAYLSLSRLSLILAACSESWNWKLEFSVTLFWFYYYRLWWSSWHDMFGIISLISILVWIFSERDLFQVTGTDTSSVLYIFVSVHNLWASHALFLPIAPGLLHCWHHLMPFCFA